jgi:hypothetical protein
MTVNTFDEFRDAIVAHLEARGATRNDLAVELERRQILRAHSVRCILSQAPSLRRRYASFASILAIADAAGFDIKLSPKKRGRIRNLSTKNETE